MLGAEVRLLLAVLILAIVATNAAVIKHRLNFVLEEYLPKKLKKGDFLP